VIERRLKAVILVYLWAALAEDTILFLMAWLAPNAWFHVFHGVTPTDLETAFLRRSGGQWAAFALAQAIALFSDLFTDISYVVAVPSLSILGWVLLLPPAALNLIGVVIMLRGYEQARSGKY
jgi:hypothetical protein